MIDDVTEFQKMVEDSTKKESKGLELIKLGSELNEKYPPVPAVGSDTIQRFLFQLKPILIVPPLIIGSYKKDNDGFDNFQSRDWYKENGFDFNKGNRYYHSWATYWHKSLKYAVRIQVDDKGYLPQWQIAMLNNSIANNEQKIIDAKKVYETVRYQNHPWRVVYDTKTVYPESIYTVWGDRFTFTITQSGELLDSTVGPDFAYKVLRSDWLAITKASDD